MFVLKTGMGCNKLPRDLLGVSGATCWRLLRDWTEARVWPAVQEFLLAELRAAGALDLNGCSVHGSYVRTLTGDHIGPSPVDRGRPGPKYHLIVDAHGIPQQVSLNGGNRNDITRPLPLVDSIPPIRGLRGRPRGKPKELLADHGFDRDKYRR